MNAVKPVTITIAGVDRSLRFTLGARRRIHDAFGMGMQEAMQKYDAASFPEILYALMHDEKGQPPNITVAELAEILPAGDSPEIMGAILAAGSNGAVEKNVAEALVRKEMERQARERLISSGFTPSPTSASELPTEQSSIGDSSNASSPQSLSSTSSENNSPIIGQD